MTYISALPAAPSRSDPANFNTRAEAFVGALATFRDQVNALAAEMNVDGYGGAAVEYTGSIDDLSLATGFYIVNTAATGTKPSGVTFGVMMVIRRGSDGSGVVEQMFYWGGNIYNREAIGGVWTSWRMQYGRSNVLATVSQSSGVPTGGLIQRGSNANGNFVRFADGTQICTHSITLTYATTTILTKQWIYPAAFSHTPFRSINLSNQSADYTNVFLSDCGQWFSFPTGLSDTTFNLYQQRGALGTWDVTSQTTNVMACAIGRWF